MAERPTDPTARPSAAFFITGAVGLIALVASVPASVLIAPPTRFLIDGPLLLLGFVMWWIAISRFAKWGTALRQVRDAAARAAAVDPEPGRRYSPKAPRLPGQRPSPHPRRERELVTEAR